MGQSHTEENYLKAIYKLSETQPKGISTKSIGELLSIKPPTVSDMLKRLGDKKLIKYVKYKGVTLTMEGEKIALKILRKHRLWETFLVEQFKFKWDEVHTIAEQLEHIDSPELVNRLDEYLGYPRFDPHGDPIPDKDGKISVLYDKTLDQVYEPNKVVFVGVKDHSSSFLQYLESLNLTLGTEIEVRQVIAYDKSRLIRINGEAEKSLSFQVCKNLLVK